MTDMTASLVLPDLSTMTKICEERILLCGPCEGLMSEAEYHERHRRLNALAAEWTEVERTEFWYTIDRLCAAGNPRVRATPGLVLTPEALAGEHVRIDGIAWERMGSGDGLGDELEDGFAVWGFALYTDPVIYSFTDAERMRYAEAKTAIVFGSA